MKFVIQRVQEASVSIEGKQEARIEKGLLVLIGVCDADTTQTADKMTRKLLGLRIFEDTAGKTNLSIQDVNGQILLVPQFTLYADCRKGNRPSFQKAGDPAGANRLFEYIVSLCRKEISVTQTGIFGADMKVSLINDGPFTILLDSEELAEGRKGGI